MCGCSNNATDASSPETETQAMSSENNDDAETVSELNELSSSETIAETAIKVSDIIVTELQSETDTAIDATETFQISDATDNTENMLETKAVLSESGIKIPEPEIIVPDIENEELWIPATEWISDAYENEEILPSEESSNLEAEHGDDIPFDFTLQDEQINDSFNDLLEREE